jgi:hypothetical protein
MKSPYDPVTSRGFLALQYQAVMPGADERRLASASRLNSAAICIIIRQDLTDETGFAEYLGLRVS